jgi:hypothetical protein
VWRTEARKEETGLRTHVDVTEARQLLGAAEGTIAHPRI